MSRALPAHSPKKNLRNPPRRRTPSHLFREPSRQDPYRSQCKPGGDVRCLACRAVNLRGDWIPGARARNPEPPVQAEKVALCPACRQARDRYAMGVVEIRGTAWRRNRALVLRTLRNTEKILRARNDQERILWTEDTPSGTFKIHVSLPELARQIGRELERSFKGAAEYRRSTEEPFLRVYWWSDPPRLSHEPGAPMGLKRRSRAAASTPGRGRVARSGSFRGRGLR